MDEFFRIKRPVGRSTHARTMGWAASILGGSGHRDRPMSYLHDVIAPAVRHEQIGFLVNRYSSEIALFVWANLNPLTVAQVQAYRSYPAHESDWDEPGDITLVDLASVQPLSRTTVAMVYAWVAGQGIVPASSLLRLRKDFSFRRVLTTRLQERRQTSPTSRLT